MSADTYTHEVQVQFRDLDPRSHVNHAVYVSYCEQAKAAFFEDVLGTSLSEAPTVVRALEVDFERPIELGDPLVVSLQVGHLGRTSYSMEFDLRCAGERTASARTASVLLDEDDRPTPLPDSWHDRLELYCPEG